MCEIVKSMVDKRMYTKFRNIKKLRILSDSLYMCSL